ncbi:VanZ family protein [Streptomyces sp. RB6PN25]|uniref:VanZ family protein n=1 Tax=Streptomyces humicola TaxID=2953240 RepID=A0ABT1Q140_9ACTN|nr:VanZ family protein [Streptomyces humicola]MCQ4082505.1 VanZ family protein [Streptomyces humicola]
MQRVVQTRTIAWARPAGVVLTALYLAVVAWFLLRPQSATWVAAGNFTPLHTIRADLALGPSEAWRPLGGGLLLLAPLGVLLPLAGGRVDVLGAASFARTVFAGLMVSFALQVVRTWFGGHLFDVDAVLLNATGVAIAHLAVVPGGRALLRRCGYGPTVVPAQGPTPTISRVGVAP